MSSLLGLPQSDRPFGKVLQSHLSVSLVAIWNMVPCMSSSIQGTWLYGSPRIIGLIVSISTFLATLACARDTEMVCGGEEVFNSFQTPSRIR